MEMNNDKENEMNNNDNENENNYTTILKSVFERASGTSTMQHIGLCVCVLACVCA